MPAPPLTHHDILGLIEPFSRRGRHVDLAASDRAERQLRFKAIDHDGGVRETLQLDVFATLGFRLTRTLDRSDGLRATLQATGDDCAALLGRFDTVDLAMHFRSGPGYTVARSYEFEVPGSAGAGTGHSTLPVLSRGVVQVDGLSLAIEVPSVRGLPAELTLMPERGGRPALPDDLLAVLGWDWARLVEKQEGWSSKLRLRGRRPRRGATVERALDKAARHLARVVAEPPRRYHERLALARWGVVLRRLIPTITALGMIVAAARLPRVEEGQAPGMWLAMHYISIGLLAFSFCLQELPRFEIPPLPRRSRAPSWFPAPGTVQAPTTGEECPATR